MSIHSTFHLNRASLSKFTYSQRQEFGEQQEGLMKPLLESFFQTRLYKTTDKYAEFDFHDPQKVLYIEVKSLQHTKYKYKHTMIGYNKIKNGQLKMRRGLRVFLVFNFSDKVCYYDLRKGIRSSWAKDFKGTDYIYIPISCLEDITETSSIFIPELTMK